MSIIVSGGFFPYRIYRQVMPRQAEANAYYEKNNISEHINTLIIKDEIYQQIRDCIGSLPAEQGGLLGSSDDGKTIDHFYWDKQAATSSTTYSPYAELINNEILPKWNKNGVRLCGFIHSHPRGFGHPSSGDAFYAQNLLSALGEERFSLPIVQSAVSGRFEIIGFVAEARENRLPAIIHYPIIIKGEEVSA